MISGGTGREAEAAEQVRRAAGSSGPLQRGAAFLHWKENRRETRAAWKADRVLRAGSHKGQWKRATR